MPNKYGMLTPQEAMAQVAAERQQMMQQPHGAAAVFGRALFGGPDPRVQEAQNVHQALKRSNNMPRRVGESEMDFQIRQGEQAYEDLRTVSPFAAQQQAEANRNLTLERDNREALRQDREHVVAEREREKKKDIRDSLLDDYGYVVRVDENGEYHDIGTINMTDEDSSLQTQRMRIEHQQSGLGGNLVTLTREEYLNNVIGGGLVDEAYSKADFGDFEEELSNNTELLHTYGSFLDLVHEAALQGQEGLSFVSSVFTRLNALGTNVRQVVDQVSGDGRGRGAYISNDGKVGSIETAAERWLGKQAGNEVVTGAMLTKMAYQLALVFNKRVTDQDFENAYRMLGGGSGDSTIAMDAMDAVFGGSWDQMERGVKARLSSSSFRRSPRGRIIRELYEGEGGFRDARARVEQLRGDVRERRERERDRPGRQAAADGIEPAGGATGTLLPTVQPDENGMIRAGNAVIRVQ